MKIGASLVVRYSVFGLSSWDYEDFMRVMNLDIYLLCDNESLIAKSPKLRLAVGCCPPASRRYQALVNFDYRHLAYSGN
jgi:hypothetical protein